MTLDDHNSRLQYFKTLEGYRIAYVDEGNGPCILLLHGLPTSSYLYRKIIPKLSSSGFRVIAPDQLGYGNSDKPAGYDIYNFEAQASRVIELMNHLKIEDWHHVCHDMGGLVTWNLAKHHQYRINGLTLLNTIIYKDGFKPPITFKNNILSRMYSRIYCSPLLGPLMISATFSNGLSRGFSLTEDEKEAYTQPLLKNGHLAIHYFFSQTGYPLEDFSNILKRLNIPIQVIWGKNDKILVWKKQSVQVMVDLKISEKDVHLLEGNHFIQEEFPDEISGILIDFIH